MQKWLCQKSLKKCVTFERNCTRYANHLLYPPSYVSSCISVLCNTKIVGSQCLWYQLNMRLYVLVNHAVAIVEMASLFHRSAFHTGHSHLRTSATSNVAPVFIVSRCSSWHVIVNHSSCVLGDSRYASVRSNDSFTDASFPFVIDHSDTSTRCYNLLFLNCSQHTIAHHLPSSYLYNCCSAVSHRSPWTSDGHHHPRWHVECMSDV